MKLFATKGVNATSVQEIVTACGISKEPFIYTLNQRGTFISDTSILL